MKPLLFLIVAAATGLQAQESPLSLIPQPVEVQRLPGEFTVRSNASVGYTEAATRPIAEMLAQRIAAATGYPVKAVKGGTGSIRLQSYEVREPLLGKEGYRLDVSAGSVVVSGNEPAGLFYGVQTLLQMLPREIEGTTIAGVAWTMPAVRVVDYPRFGWRGLMLDVSRHFFSVQEVKRYIDLMTRYKFNTFHWHLTDDNGWRVEIKAYPKLTGVGAWRVQRYGHFNDRPDPRPGEPATYGGYYTQEEIRDIVKFAQDRFVTIVPEIDLPGHSMAAIAAYPWLSTRGDTATKVNPGTAFAEWYNNGTFKMLIENAMNPADEKVYGFLENVFGEIASLFPNPYIHVGGDECYKGYWGEDEACRVLMKKLNIRHVEDLQGYFLGRLEKILIAKGKKLIGWDEILEGGISPEATVMSWRGLKGGIEAATMGHDVVMTPSSYAYLDYNQGERTVDPPVYASLRMRKVYSFEPVPEGIDSKYILGGQGNLWTEQVPTLRHAEYMTYPRAWALAEVFWSPRETRDWKSFSGRVESHFTRAEIAGVNCARAVYDAIVTTSWKGKILQCTLEAEIPGIDIYYSLDNTMPDNHALRPTGPLELPDEAVTLRVVTYRGTEPVGHLITLDRNQLVQRAGK
jgi:hexosaminidase